MFTFALAAAAPVANRPSDAGLITDGVVKVRSAYAMNETIDRLKQDVASKGTALFIAVDQSTLAADAGIQLRPSKLLVFGNPALGVQFVTSNPVAGLDWPVRLLVFQDDSGGVWIARRHRIENREAALSKASEVIASITASVQAK
jgi:uncharacterized protein (DUF302 family)